MEVGWDILYLSEEGLLEGSGGDEVMLIKDIRNMHLIDSKWVFMSHVVVVGSYLLTCSTHCK